MVNKIFCGTAIWLLLAVSAFRAEAQTPAGPQIKGRVLDQTTGKPLQDANVFLASTMLGDASDERGYFSISRVPPGVYDLVVSVIGYEVQTRRLRVQPESRFDLEFRLKPRTLLFPEITISASERRKWKKYLKKFKKLFLGTSQNAKKCKILNPEVLDFEAHKRQFSAVAEAPLEIENRALGYRLIFVLEEFTGGDGILQFWGQTKFEPLEPESEAQLRTWQKKRREAYYGSLRHFLTAALHEQLSEEGFLVFEMAQLPQPQRPMPKIRVNALTFEKTGGAPGERKWKFKGYLEIAYTREVEEPAYVFYRNTHNPYLKGARPRALIQASHPMEQRSWITLNYESILVDTAGHVLEPLAVTSYGYWAWERVAEMLPWEYTPSESQTQ